MRESKMRRIHISTLGMLGLVAFAPAMLSLQGCAWFKRHLGIGEETTAESPATYEVAEATETETTRPPSAPIETPRPTGLRSAADKLKVIYFDYNDSRIRNDQIDRMEINLKYLLDHPESKVRIDGHCDDRGTTEYNFALGDRRARSVMKYFTDNGVDEERIQVLSKGEEEPAVEGHNEAAWAKNRRCEFLFFD